MIEIMRYVFINTMLPANVNDSHVERLANAKIIALTDFQRRSYILTSLGKGVLREVEKSGREAMDKTLEKYL